MAAGMLPAALFKDVQFEFDDIWSTSFDWEFLDGLISSVIIDLILEEENVVVYGRTLTPAWNSARG
jgi:hypothetical protein